MTTTVDVITHPPETNDGIVTSWLPLTTAWPSISQCDTALYNIGPDPVFSLVAYDPFFGLHVDTRLTCLPPAATTWWYSQNQTPLLTVTSIGPVICPEAYTTASTSDGGSGSTLVMCCPSSYAFFGSTEPPGLGQCRSDFTNKQVVTYSDWSVNPTGPFFMNSTQIHIISSTLIQVALAVPVNGWLFASSTTATTTSASTSNTDTLSITSSTSIPPASASSTSTLSIASSTSIPPEIPAVSASIAQKSTGLSSGAKFGIAIGVVFTVLGICCLAGAILFVRKHSKRSKSLRGAGTSRLESLPSYSGERIAFWNGGLPGDHAHEADDGKVATLFEMSATPHRTEFL